MNNKQLKRGMIVTIKSTEDTNYRFGINSSMIRMVGKTYKIEEIHKQYLIINDFSWSYSDVTFSNEVVAPKMKGKTTFFDENLLSI